MNRPASIGTTCVFAIACASLAPTHVRAQVRGVYPLGMSATNSGVTAEPGLTYTNTFLFYSRDELRDADGETIATGSNSVLMDLNTFVWAGRQRIKALGGGRYSFSVTVPIANNSLSSDVQGALSGGGGLADTFYQPVILGWQMSRADIRAIYGFLAPTGKFDAGATDNVGSGYWTQTLAAAETIYLTMDRRTAVSAFQMYEFHGTQEGTDVHPGETFDLDYSLTHTVPLKEDVRLQIGLVGYSQWQTTDKTGPAVSPEEASARYRVNALGLAFNVMLSERKVSLGAKYFQEFSNRSTFQGYSLQVAGTVSF